MTWTLDEVIPIAVLLESIAPEFGAHVALTGGLLYKVGPRKDADMLFYCIRQRDGIDIKGLIRRCVLLGFEEGPQKGWVRKMTWENKALDFFFPEAYPASKDRQGWSEVGY